MPVSAPEIETDPEVAVRKGFLRGYELANGVRLMPEEATRLLAENFPEPGFPDPDVPVAPWKLRLSAPKALPADVRPRLAAPPAAPSRFTLPLMAFLVAGWRALCATLLLFMWPALVSLSVLVPSRVLTGSWSVASLRASRLLDTVLADPHLYHTGAICLTVLWALILLRNRPRSRR